MKHGRASTYADGCRCSDCRAAGTEYQAKHREDRKERLARGEAQVTHGRWSTYTNWGCRCSACSDAASDAKKANR